MRVRFAEVKGRRVRWYESGDAGPKLLLIHGTGASADTWVRNLPTLGQRATVVAPDLLGHGFTDAAAMAERSPQSLQVEHLLAVVDTLGWERFSVAGSSFGGLLAALTYFAAPQRVDRLILIGSASVFHPPDEQERVLREVSANQSSALDVPTAAAIRKRNVGSNFAKDDPFEEIVLLQMTAMALPDRARFFADTVEGLIRTKASAADRVIERLEAIDVPTLVITGRDDPRADWRLVEAGARRIRGAEFHIFERCGHKPYAEHAAPFNELVERFLLRP